MEKDTKNYMKYKMGFSQKLYLEDNAVPHKFHCNEDHKRQLSPQAGPSREANLKRQRTSLVMDMECLENQRTTETHTESIEEVQGPKYTICLIEKKPMMYIGIPKKMYYLVQLIHKHTNIKIENILLCLKKLRLNTEFTELADDFGMSTSHAIKIFSTNIPLLSSVLRPMVVNLRNKLMKNNLPIAFRHDYYNVSCIIDCLEIDVQNPSKSICQAVTWPEYRTGNTVKYLISCTPNGLVNYISQGFSGRASDVTIVENCSFLNELQPGTCIVADSGFKHLELLVHQKGMKLLRPPLVSADQKLSKFEFQRTKIIASLQIHIERVIQQLREFHMLKQDSVVNKNICCLLDHVMIIACALVNLQDSVI